VNLKLTKKLHRALTMGKSLESDFLALDAATEASLIAGARDAAPVKGLTHGFYKYPARFSPSFARAAIEAFTRPGDVCLDPHVGGGTTLVESIALGRIGIGVDISTLAEFVATAKTTVYAEIELALLKGWADDVANAISARLPGRRLSDYSHMGYYKHLDDPSRWRLRKSIEQGIESADQLRSPRLERFARCAVLRTAQWALDGRKQLPSVSQFRDMLHTNAIEMLTGAEELRKASQATRASNAGAIVINRSSAGLETDKRTSSWQKAKLVVTSPPYPGVHVLYHRWQVDGRKEAPLPFMIAGKLDGAGGSYYTMGDRKAHGLNTYFENIRASMSSACKLAADDAVFVQMVAFSEVEWQLPKYLETMQQAGLREVKLRSMRQIKDGRLWRSVPRRRWYSDQRGETPGSNEVVLFHMKSDATRSSYN
jgi:hypothetical protein